MIKETVRFANPSTGIAEEIMEVVPPKALPKDIWDKVPEDLRPETLARASWLVFRGATPRNALLDAMDGMRDDLSGIDPEPTWAMIMSLASVWPRFPRSHDGRYRPEIIKMASVLEAAARDVLYFPVSYDELGIALPQGTDELVVRQAFLNRVEAIKVSAAIAQS